MTFKWFYAIASVVLISLVSLIGILTISMNEDCSLPSSVEPVGYLNLIADGVHNFIDGMLPFTAGGFIYIAGSDLLPELHEELDPIKSVGQILAVGAGAGLMWTLTLLE